jgi:serine/threonine-protein kinase
LGPRTDDVEAYTAYLKGLFHWNRRTVEELKKSIAHFTDAIDLDPRFGPSYAGLADAYTVLGMYGAHAPEAVMPRARDSALRALSIEPNLAEAFVSKGCVEAVYDWKWQDAEASFRTGLELDPNYALGHQWFAANCLTPLQRFDEAIDEIDQALRIDPTSPVANTTKGIVYYFARDYENALVSYRNSLEIEPNFPITYHFMGQAQLQLSQVDEALDSIQRALRQYGESSNMLASLCHACAGSGKSTDAEEILERLLALAAQRYVSSYDLASACLAVGRDREALENLKKALEERSYLLIYVQIDPIFDLLKDSPEFLEMARKVVP